MGVNHLGDELIVVGQVCSAVDAAVGAVAAGQVGLKGLGARHSDHGRGRRAVQEGAAGPGRLAGEAPQHTGEGRGGGGAGGTHLSTRAHAHTCAQTCAHTQSARQPSQKREQERRRVSERDTAHEFKSS